MGLLYADSPELQHHFSQRCVLLLVLIGWPVWGYIRPMSANLLPDHWPLLRVGETISARLTPEQLERAIKEAQSQHGIVFRVEPAHHYWLTVTDRDAAA